MTIKQLFSMKQLGAGLMALILTGGIALAHGAPHRKHPKKRAAAHHHLKKHKGNVPPPVHTMNANKQKL